MEKKEIRRKRLKEWFADRAIPEREKSYISQLVNGKVSFGERAARRLENEYGMPTGLLDMSYEDESDSKRILSDEEVELLDLFSRLPESEKSKHIISLKQTVEAYDKLFNEMLKNRDIKEIIRNKKS